MSGNRCDGITLVTALLLILLMTMMGTLGMYLSRQHAGISSNYLQQVQAEYAAEHGLKMALEADPFAFDDRPQDINWQYQGSGNDSNYSYQFTITHQVFEGEVVTGNAGQMLYVIQSTGQSGEVSVTYEQGVEWVAEPTERATVKVNANELSEAGVPNVYRILWRNELP
jgi:hypothetical protein